MKKITFILLMTVLFTITFSLPSFRYDEDNQKVSFTTYISPLVFNMGTLEIESQKDEKLFEKICLEANLDKKVFRYNGDRIYLDYFISGFARESVNYSLNMELNSNSDFYVNTIKRAKKIYLKEYLESFKKGYILASKYFKRVDNPEKLVEKIFFIPFLANGSPEEYSYVLGTSISQNIFNRLEMSLRFKEPNSSEIKEFIEDHAYTLGVIAYIRTRYAE